jgi:hypothetical protein
MFLDGSCLAGLPVKKDLMIELIEIERQDLGRKAVLEVRGGRAKSLGHPGRIPLPDSDVNHDELDRPGIGRFGIEDLDAAIGSREATDHEVEKRPFGLDQPHDLAASHEASSGFTA